MSKFQVAHIHEQGIDLIIVPLNSSFGYKTRSEQHDVINGLQLCAASAGLKGTVVPVWESSGRMSFIAPQNWHPFFRSLDMYAIQANLNRELLCS